MRDLNYRRETIASEGRLPLVVWLAAGQVRAFAQYAPDLWAWRSAVLDFAIRPRELSPVERASLSGVLGVELETSRRRLAEIDGYLRKEPFRTETSARLFLEAARLRFALGTGTWRWRRDEALGIYWELDNVRRLDLGARPDCRILQARGETDEALRICSEEQLPVYERLGDVRSKAVTMGRIADVLQARGETR